MFYYEYSNQNEDEDEHENEDEDDVDEDEDETEDEDEDDEDEDEEENEDENESEESRLRKRNSGLFELFTIELNDILSAEKQLIIALPNLIEKASSEDLREVLEMHLEETENQVSRLENIFSVLKIPTSEKKCKGMEGILNEGIEALEGKEKSPILDATIICGAQKVEHYEISAYGSLHSFADHLDLDSLIIDLLQETLDEEEAADTKLTGIADGSLFSEGVNTLAANSSTR
ncbi:MAG: ferritin-like domain-containing protein [Candidatus Protochlamydia sp.]|nr:ferritin-like domain-containing protein [Candidatus Protochlamydia sp.]